VTIIFYIAIAAAIFSAICLIGSLFWTHTSRSTLQRIREVARDEPNPAGNAPLRTPAGSRLFAAAHWVGKRTGFAGDLSLPERLARAGYQGAIAVDTFAAARIVFPVLALAAGALIPWNRFFCMIALAGIAYLAPDMVLKRLIARRREKVRLSLPDTIDLLVICVDAGLGIDQALMRVYEDLGISHPEITEELLQINREQRAGKPRLQAWADMAARCTVAELDSFAAMLLQTERFGTPIARALSSFADNIRLKRRQHAEELAAKTTVKIIFPLVFFIFPSMFLVLLGPAVLNIVHGLSGMVQ
jgi:tight adherence protein C